MDKIEKINIKRMLRNTEIDPVTNMRVISGVAEDVYLIYLTLKPNAFEQEDLSSIQANVTGYYQKRIFYSPSYSESVSAIKPDLRTTIYWNPQITTDEKGQATVQFYNADPKSKIRIAVEGVSLTGQPIVGGATYEVNKTKMRKDHKTFRLFYINYLSYTASIKNNHRNMQNGT